MGKFFGSSPKASNYKPGPHEVMAARRSLADHKRFQEVYGDARTHMWERAIADRAAQARSIASADTTQKLNELGVSMANLITPTAGAENVQRRAGIMSEVTAGGEGQTLSAKTDVIASAQNQRIIADKGFQDIGRTEQVLGLSKARTDTRADNLVTQSLLQGTGQMIGAAKARMNETIYDADAGEFRQRGARDFFKKSDPLTLDQIRGTG